MGPGHTTTDVVAAVREPVDVVVRSDADQLAQLVALVDDGRVRVDVDRRVALADLASVHAEATAGTLRGKVVVVPG